MYTLKLDNLSGPDRELKLVAYGETKVMGSKTGSWKWLGV